MASSGGFVMLTNDQEACKRILSEIKSWPELFQELAMAENPEVQRRCLMAIANMVESDEKVAAEIMAVSKSQKTISRVFRPKSSVSWSR